MKSGLRLAIGGCLGVVVAATAVALGKQADAAPATPLSEDDVPSDVGSPRT